MAISPPRAFALGACSILVLAGVFVAGIGVGVRGNATPPGDGSMPASAPVAPRIGCPEPPGFTATRAATQRAENCAAARQVQDLLLDAGAVAAHVQVANRPSGTLLGPEYALTVTAQVYLPDSMHARWDARQAARSISAAIGTPLRFVTIVDDDFETLFDGNVRITPAPAAMPDRPPAR